MHEHFPLPDGYHRSSGSSDGASAVIPVPLADDDAPTTIGVPLTELAGPACQAPWAGSDLRDEAFDAFAFGGVHSAASSDALAGALGVMVERLDRSKHRISGKPCRHHPAELREWVLVPERHLAYRDLQLDGVDGVLIERSGDALIPNSQVPARLDARVHDLVQDLEPVIDPL